MSKTYHGSCFCKKIQYTANIDISKGTSKCNCSHCFKVRQWGFYINREDFKMIEGESELIGFGEGYGKYYFCKHCGVHLVYKGQIGDYVITGVVVTTLDDLPREELAKISISYTDGLNEDWEKTPEHINIL